MDSKGDGSATIDPNVVIEEQFINEYGFNPHDLSMEWESPAPPDDSLEQVDNSSAGPTSQGAPLPTGEFEQMSNTDVEQLIKESENKNTLKKTVGDINKLRRFLQIKGETREIHLIDTEMLDNYLANFILSVRKTDGSEYEPCTIRTMISSVERHLKRKRYPNKIMNSDSNHFQLTRDAL